MKKLFLFICFIGLAISCDDENANDCFQTAGPIVQQEFDVPEFDKIVFHKKVELFITQGDVQKVIVETGENLLNDVTVKVENKEIIIRDNNSCNFVRDYNVTKVYITSPNITRIRNASEYSVTSNGILTYPNLYLMSVGDKDKFLAVGDFNITVDNEKLRVWGNAVGNFYIKGKTNNLDISFSDGDPRFEGKELIAKNVVVNQISSNDMVVYPVESLTGEIHSTGDVISYNRPPVVDVIENNKYGKLIFKE
ncbi:head GIN domain-containing protein [Lutibacter sp. B1]|uniref:head GIN domain-containing protein n=1 Tax=Lutibacter sp. B1 TaxID=2725996 RepID=UPI00145642CE|nr:head GIN domain-containing protein [Lutibacter sp. B1]NLP58861.1 DUF2807 domain-containing protein [Lutibacter sp. B1]